jgi:hypothetical protein
VIRFSRRPSRRNAGAGQGVDRRLDEGGGQGGMGDAGPARLAALGQGLAHDGGGKIGGALARVGVEHRQQEGVEQPVP